MESRFSWLDSVPQAHSSSSQSALAPPPVSFGFSSNSDLQQPRDQYKFANNSADNISDKLQRHEVPGDENSIPLSLTAQELSLEESKTYMRWYLDILARTNQRTVSIADVYQFLSNFRLSAAIKEKINRVFSKILSLINIGQFFALLRVVSHTLQGSVPTRALIKLKAPVPVPPLILSKKRQNDDPDDELKHEQTPPAETQPAVPLDLDLFTQFMLTGERPEERAPKKRLKKLKLVKFSDQIVTDVHDVTPDLATTSSSSQPLDYSLPMDQLLSRINNSKTLAVPANPQPVSSPDPEEKQILRDMEGQMNHFQNLHSVDTMLIDGVPANIHLAQNLDFSLPRLALPQLLKPNMTGPAQMAQMGFPSEDASPLRPNITGPADMARYFSPDAEDVQVPQISLQSFTSQMTGDTAANTAANTMMNSVANASEVQATPNFEEKQLPPPPVPATRRVRSFSQPSPVHINWETESQKVHQESAASPHSPTKGLAVPEVPSRQRSSSASPGPPLPPRSPLGNLKSVPPPPPPSRRTMTSSKSPSPLGVQSIDQIIGDTLVPPPLPQKIPHSIYQNGDSSSSTANILDDLKALQDEVDRIRDMTGGF